MLIEGLCPLEKSGLVHHEIQKTLSLPQSKFSPRTSTGNSSGQNKRFLGIFEPCWKGFLPLSGGVFNRHSASFLQSGSTPHGGKEEYKDGAWWLTLVSSVLWRLG